MPQFTPPLTQGSAFPNGVRVGNIEWANYSNGSLTETLAEFSNGVNGVPMGIDYPYWIRPVSDSLTNLRPAATIAGASSLPLTAGAGVTVSTTAYPGYTAYVLDVARNINIQGASIPAAVTFTISGWDMYGAKVVDQMTLPIGNNIRASNKALKAIHTIQASAGTGAGTVSIGVGQYFGMPYLINNASNVFFMWNGVPDYAWNAGAGVFQSQGGFTPGLTQTTVPTATSTDVRGLYQIHHTMNGTTPLVAYIALPQVDPIYTRGAVVNPSLVYGVPQYSTGWL